MQGEQRGALEFSNSISRVGLYYVAMVASCAVAPAAFAQSTSVLQAASIVSGGETRPQSSSLQPSGAITIETWVTAPTAVTNYPAFVSYGLDSGSPYESYVLQAQSINGAHAVDFYFLTGSGTAHQLFGATHLVAGTRYHIVATYDGATAKIYINGALDASSSISGQLYYPAGSYGLGLARKYSPSTNSFSGTEQGVAIYNTALTAAQISAHYAAGPLTPLAQVGQVPSGGATEPGSAALQPSTAVSVAAWINAPTAATNYPVFVSYGIDTAPYESYVLQAQDVNGTKPADFFFLTGSGTFHQLFGTTHLAAGTQYFLTATYNGSAATIYVNGVAENSAAISGSLYYPAGGGLGLGRKYSDNGATFSGTERGVSIYGNALTSDQIAALYQAGSPPTAPGSVTATGASSTQINLTWSASNDAAGVTGYLVERCSGTACSAFSQVGSSSTTSYSDTGLTSGTYTYRIRSVNTGNNVSDYSTTSTASTTSGGGGGPDTTAPTVPSGLVTTNVGTITVSLAWTASTDNLGVTAYLVERCQGMICTDFTQIASAGSAAYIDGGVAAMSTYRYRVRATDAAGNLSGYSGILNVTTAAGSSCTQ